MDKLINKEPISGEPLDTKIESRPFGPIDLDGDGAPDQPRGGRTDPVLGEENDASDDYFGESDNQSSQSDIDQDESSVDVTTDIANSFGEYGEVFLEIIKQLESFFTHGRDTADYVNRSSSSLNPFAAWMMAISGIADKIGDGTEQTNLTNALNQMMSFYMQQVSAGMQNQFNIQQWQVQNEYNSPAEQLKRLSGAGLNPLHFFDSGSSGSSTSVTASSGSSPNVASAALGKTKAERVLGGISTGIDVAKTVASAALGGKEAAIQAAQLPGIISKQAQDVVESEQRVGSMKAQQALNEQQSRNLAQTEALNQEMHPKLLKAQDNLLHLQDADLTLKGKVSDEKDVTIEQIVANTKLAVQDYLYKEGVNHLKVNLTKAQIDHTYSLARNQDSITELNKIRKDFQETYGIPAESNLAYFLAVKVMNGSWTREQFQQFLTDLNNFSGSESSNPFVHFGHAISLGISKFIRMFDDASSYNSEEVSEYNRLGNEMKNATENVKRNLNEYSVDEINAVNGR